MSEPTDAPYVVMPARGTPIPLIAHVPHAATNVPERVRRCIVLDDAELRREIVRLTDWRVDRLFSWVRDLGGEMFVATLLRVGFDAERYDDDAKEPMAEVGQGVVYTHTTQRGRLAEITPEERAWRIEHWYLPYHAAFEARAAALLERFGAAFVLDCHSFATVPLPSEPDQAPNRPDVCLGTDAGHTPPALADALERSLAVEGLRVGRDSPFAGTIVPSRFYGTDDRVRSVMIEVRRGLYCDEATGGSAARFGELVLALERAVGGAVAELVGAP